MLFLAERACISSIQYIIGYVNIQIWLPVFFDIFNSRYSIFCGYKPLLFTIATFGYVKQGVF
jgi:hypothetical protein